MKVTIALFIFKTNNVKRITGELQYLLGINRILNQQENWKQFCIINFCLLSKHLISVYGWFQVK